jgi:hypothetical protein
MVFGRARLSFWIWRKNVGKIKDWISGRKKWCRKIFMSHSMHWFQAMHIAADMLIPFTRARLCTKRDPHLFFNFFLPLILFISMRVYMGTSHMIRSLVCFLSLKLAHSTGENTVKCKKKSTCEMRTAGYQDMVDCWSDWLTKYLLWNSTKKSWIITQFFMWSWTESCGIPGFVKKP